MEIFLGHIDGNLAHLDADESAHCVRVMRHREGDTVEVIDGEGTLYHCRLTIADAKGAVAEVVDKEPNWGSHPYSLTLAVCPTKNIDRYEWMVEKATEIGVDIIVPVIGDRSERKVIKTDRLHRLVVAATKQSLKSKIPTIAEPISVRDFIASATGTKLICYCSDEIKPRLSINDIGTDNNYSVLIGPEGDFSPEEVKLALDAGFETVHLGPSRLRTETAAIVATTAIYLNNIQQKTT